MRWASTPASTCVTSRSNSCRQTSERPEAITTGSRGASTNREVRANRVRKSVGAENTFSIDLTEFEAMVSELQPLIDKVWRHCEDKGSRGRTVTLKVKFADFELISRSRTVVAPVVRREELANVTTELLRALFPVKKPVRLLGVSISGFVG